MKSTTAIAAATLIAGGGIAHADCIINLPGTYVFNTNGAHAITTDAITGTITGIKVSFTYQYLQGNSTAYDVGFTVGDHQWGGYLPFINGAGNGECPTGAPSLPNTITFTSGVLGIGPNNFPFNHQPVLVGFGNTNAGGGCIVSNVSITLFGVVPTPGAAGALSLGGLAFARRPRR